MCVCKCYKYSEFFPFKYVDNQKYGQICHTVVKIILLYKYEYFYTLMNISVNSVHPFITKIKICKYYICVTSLILKIP